MTDDRPRVRPQPPRGRWLPLLASLPGLAFIALPIGALLWLGFSEDAMRAMWLPASLQAMRVSLTVATSATLVCVMLGLPIAWWLSRDPRVGARLVRGLAMTPLVMPPVVAGTGLLLTLGRKGLLGAKLDALGLSISFTSLAAVLAAAEADRGGRGSWLARRSGGVVSRTDMKMGMPLFLGLLGWRRDRVGSGKWMASWGGGGTG